MWRRPYLASTLQFSPFTTLHEARERQVPQQDRLSCDESEGRRSMMKVMNLEWELGDSTHPKGGFVDQVSMKLDPCDTIMQSLTCNMHYKEVK